MADTNLGAELSAINFDQIIGAPLKATINAQASAAMSTLEFISKIGFKQKSDNATTFDLNTVDFTYDKSLPDADGSGALVPSVQKVSVPMLSIVPVPFIRIESLDIDLNVKLHSVQENTTTNDFAVKADGSFSAWFNTVKFNVSASERNVSVGKSSVDRQYNLGIKVRAVQDDMPTGLSRILNIFDDLVQPKSIEAKSEA